MSAPEWMNWGDWRWIGLAIALAEGFWMGWYCCAARQRHREILDRLAKQIAELEEPKP